MELNAYYDRNGQLIKKPLLSEKGMRFLYTDVFGRVILKIMTSVTAANLERAFLGSPFSSLIIDSFIKKNGIDMSDYVPQKYRCFNEFFTRKVKEGKRTICSDPKTLITPSDGRVSVYKIDKDSCFEIKNSTYSVQSLLRSKKLSKYYEGGYFVLIRLCVDNYHRYCYAADGVKGIDRRIDGYLHTVNPIVYDFAKVYTENTRQYCVIDTGDFNMVQMEIGAMGVGRITNHELFEADVKKGEEKGFFEFGGSSIALLVPKGKVIIDNDLLENTAAGYETAVKYGEKIGKLL